MSRLLAAAVTGHQTSDAFSKVHEGDILDGFGQVSG